MSKNILPIDINKISILSSYKILYFTNDDQYNNRVQYKINRTQPNWKMIECFKVDFKEFTKMYSDHQYKLNSTDVLIIGCGRILSVVHYPNWRELEDLFYETYQANIMPIESRYKAMSCKPDSRYDFLTSPLRNSHSIIQKALPSNKTLPDSEIDYISITEDSCPQMASDKPKDKPKLFLSKTNNGPPFSKDLNTICHSGRITHKPIDLKNSYSNICDSSRSKSPEINKHSSKTYIDEKSESQEKVKSVPFRSKRRPKLNTGSSVEYKQKSMALKRKITSIRSSLTHMKLRKKVPINYQSQLNQQE